MSKLSETYFGDMDDSFVSLSDSPNLGEEAESGEYTFHRENPSNSGHYVAVTTSGYSDLFYSAKWDCWNYFDSMKKPKRAVKDEWDQYVKGWLELPPYEKFVR